MPAGSAWDGRFFEKDPRFWPIAAAARRFADRADFPDPEELEAPGIRFVRSSKPRRTRRTREPAPGYDARVVGGEVPTRARSWHDFLNALVWATFPHAKRALHARQAAAIQARTPAGPLPNARTREQDALALLDEGGVLVLESPNGVMTLGFGHALYEGLVVGGPPATASALGFSVPHCPAPSDALPLADSLLAARLREELLPSALARRTF
ncbi:MAG TPA: DUF3025 domain-containing protein [Polyangiaceae bacterium]|nr:DUF3025 domain-containing protein [Polyangiaceae bacterium]